MKYRLKLTKGARRDLVGLERGVQEKIVHKLWFYVSQKDPFRYAKKLKTSSGGLFRFRIGNYRVIFKRNKKGDLVILLILTIGHRKDVYR